MIYDNIENLGQYTGLFENLDTAIAWIGKHGLKSLPGGRTAIDGDKVFLNVSTCETRPSAGADFEYHSRYMDLQIDLEGTELFEVGLGKQTETSPYDAATDSGLCQTELSCAGVLGEGRFVIFMTDEAHKPAIRAVGCEKVKKAVFKIAYDD